MAVPLLPGPAAMPLASIVTHDVTIVTTRKLAQARVMGVPPEEFGIERGARSIRDCNYCFHEVVTKTEAQLIAEGFDADLALVDPAKTWTIAALYLRLVLGHG